MSGSNDTIMEWFKTLLPVVGVTLAFYVTQTTTAAVLTERLDSLINAVDRMGEEMSEGRSRLSELETRVSVLEVKENIKEEEYKKSIQEENS